MGPRSVHAVVCAYPALGHLHPLLRLSILLLQRGLRVTFVCTSFYCDSLRDTLSRNEAQFRPRHRVTQAEGSCLQQEDEDSRKEEDPAENKQERWHLQGKEEEEEEDDDDEAKIEGTGEGCIVFEGLHDGLPVEFDRTSPSTELSEAVDQLHGAFAKLVYRLRQESSSSASFFLITDAFLPWTHDVAMALRVPRVIFWPQSAAVFSIFGQTDHIVNCGVNPFRGHMIDFPGLPSLPVSHLPYRVKPVKGQDRRFLSYENLAKQFRHCREATCILINSHESLESFPVKDLVNEMEIPIRLVGPLVSVPYLEGQLSRSRGALDFADVWEWLNTKTPSSVLYICLGSVVSWRKSQMEEVSWGLLSKQQAFLWVVRPWEMRQVLPHDLLKLGRAVNFAPQAQVLRHPAIGGFFSHCGWNFTLECLSAGLPVLAWPHFLDQFTNCWYVVHVWKVGVELSLVDGGNAQGTTINRDHVARAISLLMESENGHLMRSRAFNLKKILQMDLQGWSSCKSLDLVLSQIAGLDSQDIKC